MGGECSWYQSFLEDSDTHPIFTTGGVFLVENDTLHAKSPETELEELIKANLIRLKAAVSKVGVGNTYNLSA